MIEAKATALSHEPSVIDIDWEDIGETALQRPAPQVVAGGSRLFWFSKRCLDILVSLCALPVVAAMALVVVALNPFFNPGSLLYRQKRMGMDGQPFIALKFRSMTEASKIDRGPYDDIEDHRITRLGRLLRRLRIDEFPQFWNILRGDMSLIGPRPDYYLHAVVYCHDIPQYAHRYLVRPGITGLAQVRSGYASCPRSVTAKVRDDMDYIESASWRMELRVIAQTVWVICNGFGYR